MRLREYIQLRLIRIEQGTERVGSAETNEAQSAADDLARVQKTNEWYFAVYWITLVVVFVGTLIVAIIFRSEMGGLGAVLGAGGVLQGGLVLKLSSEWKEKARIDIVAALSRRLPPAELQVVLKEILGGLSK